MRLRNWRSAYGSVAGYPTKAIEGEARMLRRTFAAALLLLPALALGGANPFVTGAPPAPASNKKYENLFKKEEDPLSQGRADGNPSGGAAGQAAEPIPLPRDGVTDDMLEKYRLKK